MIIAILIAILFAVMFPYVARAALVLTIKAGFWGLLGFAALLIVLAA